MKFIYTVLICLFISKGFSQEFSGMFSIDLNKKSKIYSSIDKNESNVVLCFSSNENTQAILLDENTNLINLISTKSFPNYNKIITEYTSNKKTKFVWANDDLTSFLVQSFDFNNNEAYSKAYSFYNKDKKLLQVFFNNDELQILAISSIDKNISITSISNDGSKSENAIRAENSALNTLNNLYNYTYTTEKNNFSLVRINENKYNSFSETHSLSKCYLKNDTFVICLDMNPNETEILSINIKDKTAVNNIIKRETIENIISYNSLIIDNNIFQVEQNKANYYLSVKDMQGNIIKKFSENDFQISKYFAEYELGKIDEIERKNYFKKINNQELGLTYTKFEGNLYLTIGSPIKAKIPSDEYHSNGPTVVFNGGSFAGVTSGSSSSTASYGPNLDNYSEFISKGQIYGQIKMDSNYSVLPSFKKEFSFNKLKTLIVNSNSYAVPIVFTMKNIYYLGFYSNNEKRYFLKKFIN
nr:hypothetical protein [uncultured Flavobacterium sp.]